MRRTFVRLGMVLVLSIGVATPVWAQEGDEQKPPGAGEGAEEEEAAPKRASKWKRQEKIDKRYQMGPRFGKKFLEAAEAYGEEDYKRAIVMFDKIPSKSSTPFERANKYQMLAYSFHADGQPKNARKAMGRAVEANGFPIDKQGDAIFSLARLDAQAQDWDAVVKTMDKWFALGLEPNGSAYNMVALAYFQQNKYDEAVEPAQKSYELMEVPNEGWIRLLLALRLTRQEYKESIPLLERLVADFPKKGYWMQLSTVHGATGSYENALVPLQLAYAQGLLTEDAEIRRMAQLQMFLELPYRAAEALQKGLDASIVKSDVDAWEMLSNSWIAAREYDRAVKPLEKAATLDKTGDLYMRLAQVHIQREKWDDAIVALDRGIAKGDLAKPCDALILMGIAHYSNKSPARARGWFARAGGYRECRDESSTWVTFIDRELQQIAAEQEQQAEEAAADAAADSAL